MSLGKIIAILLSIIITLPVVSLADENAMLAEAITRYQESIGQADLFWAPVYATERQADFSNLGLPNSKDYFKKRNHILEKARIEFRKINARLLTEESKADLFIIKEDLVIQSMKYKLDISKYLLFTAGNYGQGFIDMAVTENDFFPFESEKNYSDFISRMNQFKKFADAMIAIEREGIAKGYVAMCEHIDILIENFKPVVDVEFESNLFYDPIDKLPNEFSESAKAQIESRYRLAFKNSVQPAYQNILNFLSSEYKSKCRVRSGLSKIPQGHELYKMAIAQNIGSFLDPYSIMSMGFKEVDRIKKEMALIQKQFGFKGSLKAFIESMRTDPKNYFSSDTELINAHAAVLDKINRQIPKIFSLIPTTQLSVLPHSSDTFQFAYYLDPKPNRPYGAVMLPVFDVKTLPKYEVTALMMHEAIPGHHFQLALDYENKNVSTLRRNTKYSTAFIEGWGLYAESLGTEMHLYDDSYQRFGQLNMEMLRACRLVIDAGLHYFDWSRDQGIAYLSLHTGYTKEHVENEIDRYIDMPGQAIAYKVGQLKIQELRHYAETRLGPRFDIKEFHKKVLESGSVSLGYLDQKIKSWAAKKH